jgi:hypothetical protein
MSKLLFLLITVSCLSCVELTPEEEIANFFQEEPVAEFITPEVPLSMSEQPLGDYHEVRVCVHELVVIAYNCWFVFCHAPCLPSDYGCSEFYCEWGESGEETPR